MIRLPLTHQLLAMLAGSHRPTVTIAAGKLADRGLLIRQAPHRWLLTHQAIQSLSDLGRRFAIADRPEKRGQLLVQNGR